MKTRVISLLTAILCLLIIASFAAADAGLYPIGQQQTQSYPVPQYHKPQPQPQQPPTQQPYSYNNPYYNNPYYNNPYYNNQYYNNPYYNNPYYPYGNPAPTQVPPTPTKPQPNNHQQQGPFYEPNSGYYFYPIQQPQQPWQQQNPGGPWQNNPGNQNNNVQVSAKWGYNGTLDLTWTIKNVTTEDWGKKNIDIKCTGGCYLLTNPNQTLWDLPYTVNRNDRLTFTVNIRQPGPYDDAMTFAIVAGSKTLYTFSVKPR